MKKTKGMKIFQKIIPVFFLLVFIEIMVLGVKDEISLTNLLEITAALLLIVLYYFLIRMEFKLASKELEENLSKLANRFDVIENNLKEEIKILSEEIKELRKILKK